jgi:hypothetical protein
MNDDLHADSRLMAVIADAPEAKDKHMIAHD